MYKQERNIDGTTESEIGLGEARNNFDVTEFANMHRMTMPVAGNFFIAENK